jgi:hypothetical protein
VFQLISHIKSEAEERQKIVSEADRRENHRFFWSLDWEQRKVYVHESIEKSKTFKHSSPAKKRQKLQRKFYLRKGNKRIRVCLKMYLSTLSMKESTMRRWSRVKPNVGNCKGTTGKVIISNPTNQERFTHAKKILERLPKVPSHYCRKSNKRLYLEPPWTSMAQVYRY